MFLPQKKENGMFLFELYMQ